MMSAKMETRPSSSRSARLLFGVVLLGLGIAVLAVGWDAIQRRHYEMEWKARGPVRLSHGVLTFNGAAAVRIGAGLVCFGAMLATWGLALTASFMRRDSAEAAGKRSSRALAWISLACLVGAAGCIFPPWEWHSLFFYAVVLAVGILARAMPDDKKRKLGGFVLPAVIGAAMVAAVVNPGAAVSILMGFLASLALLVHILLLFPKLQDRLLPE